MTLVFQYGSNASSIRLNSDDRLRGAAKPIGPAYTEEEFQLGFTTWSERNDCAAADIIPGSGRKIWGVIYEVPDILIRRDTSGERKSFDAIEGRNYQRIPIKLRHPDGSPVSENAITYVVISKTGDIRTSLDYVKHIIAGLRENNIPEEYIEYVKAKAIQNNSSLEPSVQKL